jgi:monoamine oxidase
MSEGNAHQSADYAMEIERQRLFRWRLSGERGYTQSFHSFSLPCVGEGPLDFGENTTLLLQTVRHSKCEVFSMGYSRRDFLMRVGQAGGYSAAFVAMQSMGLAPMVAEAAVPLSVAPGTGKGVKVVVLGGGIAGLVAAYEMKALGYECTVLEARERPGGRNWTVRGGDEVVFTDGTKQRCTWDAGNYQNVGPARLPSIHKTMLGYCRKFGIEMQVEVNTSRSSLLQNDAVNGGKPMVQREVEADTRGHVSELLAKCVSQGALDQEMSKDDRDRMLTFLRKYGSLDDAGKYVGSDAAGYSVTAGAGDDAGVLSQPVDMHTLLDADFWDGILFEEAFDMQATMFQPVGGMDRIPYAFKKALGETVIYSAPVTELRKTAKGVRVGYTHAGSTRCIEADYCVCALPLTMMKKMPNDLSAPYQQVIRAVYVFADVQDCVGEPAVLGAGLQHLWRAGVCEAGMQPGVAAVGGNVFGSRRAGERVRVESAAGVCCAGYEGQV